MEPWSRYAAGHEPINFALIIIQYCAKCFMLLLPFYNHLQPVQFITGGDIDTYIDTVCVEAAQSSSKPTEVGRGDTERTLLSVTTRLLMIGILFANIAD